MRISRNAGLPEMIPQWLCAGRPDVATGGGGGGGAAGVSLTLHPQRAGLSGRAACRAAALRLPSSDSVLAVTRLNIDNLHCFKNQYLHCCLILSVVLPLILTLRDPPRPGPAHPREHGDSAVPKALDPKQ